MTMMKTTVERLADDQLRLDIEVPQDVLQDAVEATLDAMGREMRLPGFRPGKVPAQAVLARVGRDAAVAEAIRMHLDDWYRAAVIKAGIRPIEAPEIEIPGEDAPGDGPLKIEATVRVSPKPKLPELATLEVDKPNVPDTKKWVDQVLDATLRGAGTLVDTGAGAAPGDEVVVDFHCTADGERVSGAAAVGYQAQIGDGRLLEELEGAITGQSAESELEVEVDFPGDHPMPELAGKHATFHVNIREVKRLEVPELTDEVAVQVSEFETAAALVADITSSITARLENEVAGIFRANAVTALAKAAEFEEPAMLVERRQQDMYMDLKNQLGQSGLNIEAYLDRTGKDSEALFAELGENARDDVRRELALLALAEDAAIEVHEDHLRAEIAEHSEATGEDPEEAYDRIMASGRAEMLASELLMQHTIDYLVENVKPVAIDLPVPEDGESEEAAAARASGSKGVESGQDHQDEE